MQSLYSEKKNRETADYVTTISDNYYRACYQKRNIWMVDHSSLVIAVFNGTASGTKNTVDYALQKNLKVINVICNISMS